MSLSSSQIAVRVVAATLLAQLLGFAAAGRATVTSASLSYAKFRSVHRKSDDMAENRFQSDFGHASVTYIQREALFNARVAQVAAHNAQGKSWTETVNHFADYTAHELNFMLGHKKAPPSGDGSSFLQMSGDEVESIDLSSLAKTVDWTKQMNFSNAVHNQGACGSCWAHAAVGALEAHAEIATGLQSALSTQEIIDCSPNPRHCGGTGGCHGATAEIAFELARSRGISLSKDYKGTKGQCAEASSSAIKVSSFVRLPENKASHLVHTLATKGPVALSIDASSLFSYHEGVFAGCQPDTVVNHAVLGLGYGTDEKGKDYWLIKNSWGDGWGEATSGSSAKGYFRLERFNEDSAFCGTDNKPQDGVYCEKHPASVPVCGMCGIASDSTYPVIPKTLKTSLRQGQAKLSKVKPSSWSAL